MSRFDQGIPCCDVYPFLNPQTKAHAAACSTHNYTKVLLNVCVNEGTPIGAFAAAARGEMSSHSDGTKRSLPTRRDCGPVRYKRVLHRETYFVKRFVYFRTLCGVESSPLNFSRNRVSSLVSRVVRYRRRHG